MKSQIIRIKQVAGQLSLVRFFFGKEMNEIADTNNSSD